MKERVLLLRREVERRGYKWGADEVGEANEDADAEMRDAEEEAALGVDESREGARPAGGSIGDEALVRLLREQMEEHAQEEDYGVHL